MAAPTALFTIQDLAMKFPELFFWW